MFESRRLRVPSLEIRRHPRRRHAHVPRPSARLTRADRLLVPSSPSRRRHHQLIPAALAAPAVVHLRRLLNRARVQLLNRRLALRVAERALTIGRPRRGDVVRYRQTERSVARR